MNNKSVSQRAEESPHENRVTALMQQHTSFSGPLPPPDAFAEYERILPWSAERILVMAETQATHRQSLESQTIRYEISIGKRAAFISLLGVLFAFVLWASGILVGAYLVYLDKAITGSLFAGTAFFTLIGAFIYGTRMAYREEK